MDKTNTGYELEMESKFAATRKKLNELRKENIMNYQEHVVGCCDSLEKPKGELRNRIECFYGNLKNLNAIAEGLEEVLERLIGQEPTDPCGSGKNEVPHGQGLLADLVNMADRYSAVEYRLGTVMERLKQSV